MVPSARAFESIDVVSHGPDGRLMSRGETVASRSVSRILCRVSPATAICLGPPSPVTSMRPTCRHRAGRSSAQAPKCPLGLAPDGVCPAARVATGAGGLLHHRFTLTSPEAGGLLSVALFPRVAPGGCYPPSCPVESGLSSTVPKEQPRPPDRLASLSVRMLGGEPEPDDRHEYRHRDRMDEPGRGPRPAGMTLGNG